MNDDVNYRKHLLFLDKLWIPVKIKACLLKLTSLPPSPQENILQKVVMTAFADRTVVIIAVSISPLPFTVMHTALALSQGLLTFALHC